MLLVLLLLGWVLGLLGRNAALLTLNLLLLSNNLLVLVDFLLLIIFFSDDSLLSLDFSSNGHLRVISAFLVANLAALGSSLSLSEVDIRDDGDALGILRLVLGGFLGFLSDRLDLSLGSHEHGLLSPVAGHSLD